MPKPMSFARFLWSAIFMASPVPPTGGARPAVPESNKSVRLAPKKRDGRAEVEDQKRARRRPATKHWTPGASRTCRSSICRCVTLNVPRVQVRLLEGDHRPVRVRAALHAEGHAVHVEVQPENCRHAVAERSIRLESNVWSKTMWVKDPFALAVLVDHIASALARGRRMGARLRVGDGLVP